MEGGFFIIHTPQMKEQIFIRDSSVPMTLERTADKELWKDLIVELLNGLCAISSSLAFSKSDDVKPWIVRS